MKGYWILYKLEMANFWLCSYYWRRGKATVWEWTNPILHWLHRNIFFYSLYRPGDPNWKIDHRDDSTYHYPCGNLHIGPYCLRHWKLVHRSRLKGQIENSP